MRLRSEAPTFVRPLLICACWSFLAASAFAQKEKPKFTYADRPIGPNELRIQESGGKLDAPPKFLRGDTPKYPITMAWKRHGGNVVLAFTIDETGRTKDFQVVSNDDAASFADHSIIAVKNWRFEPARRNGKPVPVRVTTAFHFTADPYRRVAPPASWQETPRPPRSPTKG